MEVWTYDEDDFPQSRIILAHVWIAASLSNVDSQIIFTMLLSNKFVLQSVPPDFDEDG